MGTLLFVLLIVLVLAVLLGAGGYSVRRYWSPAGSEVVETSGDMGSGAGAGVAAAILALLVLILLFFGFTQWNWFGTRSGAPSTINNPSITSPAPGQQSPSGGGASPSAKPSPS
ncbi:MAG TPA: hypothetical protein VGE99_07660 [Candidatus Dormibacteraeota bacterium]